MSGFEGGFFAKGVEAGADFGEGGGWMACCGVFLANFEAVAPLVPEGAVGVEEAVGGVVNVGGFGGDAVELEDFEITSGAEVFEGGDAEVVATEVEAGEGAGDALDFGGECGGDVGGSIEEEGSAAVGA